MINAKNLDKILPSPHYILVPRFRIFITVFVHTLILNIGCILFYNVFAIISLTVLTYEIFYHLTIIKAIWKRVGYSMPLFYTGFGINIAANLILGIFEREWLTEFTGQLLFNMR